MSAPFRPGERVRWVPKRGERSKPGVIGEHNSGLADGYINVYFQPPPLRAVLRIDELERIPEEPPMSAQPKPGDVVTDRFGTYTWEGIPGRENQPFQGYRMKKVEEPMTVDEITPEWIERVVDDALQGIQRSDPTVDALTVKHYVRAAIERAIAPRPRVFRVTTESDFPTCLSAKMIRESMQQHDCAIPEGIAVTVEEITE